MSEDYMLNIIHVNDTEGEPADVWPRLATAIGQARAAGNCDLLVHSGDIPLETDTAQEGARAMQALGFDAVALGNHDVTESDSVLRSHLATLETPMLCANVTGLPPDLVCPYRRLRVKDWQVVLIGVTLRDLPRYVIQRRIADLTVHPPEQVLAELVPRLRNDIDLVVVVSHCGHSTDTELARTVPGIDLIIGGHDHLLLPQPEQVNGTWVAQAGADGAYMGHITVRRSAERLQITGGHIPTAGLPPDTNMLALLTRTELDPTELEVVGHTSTDLCIPGLDVRSPAYWRETPLGNLTVDLMCAYAATDLALLRCASVINELPAGPIRRRDLRRLNWSGSDQVVRLALNGQELIEVLESGARGGYHLLLTAGARVVYNMKRPIGQRIVSLQVGNCPLAPDRMYTIACSEVLANGVGDYPVVATKPREVLPRTVEELLAEHIQSKRTIRPELDGRLVIHF